MTLPRTAAVGHTHLFPGARLELGPGAVEAGALSVRLSDGVEIEADLIDLDGAGALILAVPAFTTKAGAAIEAKVWSVREIVSEADDEILVLGRRTELQRD